ncbi:hypothetical protein IAE30_29190 [Pantoea sp. S61]|uniref:hypothetical protein n=1 Tax=Pantoea sp. S61 TaxID=2767442 RepID=UPI00190D98FC|nr:hypothetical protein [Pantoea sp. S61]MBK0127819.1 hypothetical protein [Pantoea sp. S61]
MKPFLSTDIWISVMSRVVFSGSRNGSAGHPFYQRQGDFSVRMRSSQSMAGYEDGYVISPRSVMVY